MKKTIVIVYFFIFGYTVSGQTETDKKTCKDCHRALIEQKVVHAVAADDCESCHTTNGNEHPKQGVKGFDLVEKVPALCFMCHEQNSKTNIHPPSEAGECLTCHSPHASANKGLLIKGPQAALCADCHDTGPNEKPVKHKPVSEGNCTACHDPHQSDFSRFLKVEKPQLCYNCHATVQKQTELKTIHPPFTDDCANCHETHSADTEKLLLQKIPGLCYNCHDMQTAIENAKVVHKVVNDARGCANCHSAHATDNEKLLITNGKDLCLSCHSKIVKTGERTLANIGMLLKKGNTIHGAIEGDGCTACHNPHASEQTLLLKGAFPEGQYVDAKPESFELCFTCHDQELLTTETSATATQFRNGEQNLHYLHVNGEKGRNCNVCHNVHGSASAHLINDKVKFGSWDMPIQFQHEENGGSCNTGCHAKKKYAR
jgi:predicted CXXCH cytochrome family protein